MRVSFEGRTHEGPDGESVLECLERHGVEVASFCRNGACQTCLMKAVGGEVPAAARQGVKESWQRQGYFLACMCRHPGLLEVARCDAARAWPTRVLEATRLQGDVLRVRIARPEGFEFAAGQFVQLIRPADGLMRPYSIASLPSDAAIELHVAMLPGGRMSQWLTDAAGTAMQIRGPFGECSYWQDEPDRPLLLAGTGTGLAPLLGVLRAALAAGHRAPIRLFHGSRRIDGLYMWEDLRALQAASTALSIHGSVLEAGSEPQHPAGVSSRALAEQVLGLGDSLLAAHRVYLCGNPQLVRELRREIYLAGVPFARIHADPFLEPARV